MEKSKEYDKLKFDIIQKELKVKKPFKLDVVTKTLSHLVDGKWVAYKMKRIK